jgi:hypothetical protein
LIPGAVEILGSSCFWNCKSFSSISFESNSRLIRIESYAFSYSSLQSILIPCSVEILGSQCFSNCDSLSSIQSQFPSQLKRIERQAFGNRSSLVVIPSTILFVASDAIYIPSQITMVDNNSCPEFDRWRQVRESNIAVDFRRILRVGSGLLHLDDYEVNLWEFENVSIIGGSDQVLNEIYERADDKFLMILTSIPLSESIEKFETDNEIENLINLHHPCIAGPIGFISGTESGWCQELKIARLHSEGCSLAEVISLNPVWWTATVKAKVVAGIVLGLRFAHSHGLMHGHLSSSNIVFDVDHEIEIANFNRNRIEMRESEDGTKLGGFSGERWTPKTDVRAFASILFEIVSVRSVNGETFIPTDVPDFVLRIIESELRHRSDTKQSFHDIFEILKNNGFQIAEGVDYAEVSAFVRWVESAEQSKE